MMLVLLLIEKQLTLVFKLAVAGVAVGVVWTLLLCLLLLLLVILLSIVRGRSIECA